MMKFFSDDYEKQLYSLKSEKFCGKLKSELSRVHDYLREDEFVELYQAIEEAVPIKERGNMILSNSFGSFSDRSEDAEEFMREMMEDIWFWFLNDAMLKECSLFIFCVHIKNYIFTEEDTDNLIYAIMSNFIADNRTCPDVFLVPCELEKEELSNGYYILALK